MYEYDLLAVVNHEGQMDGGHYTNFARCHDRVRYQVQNAPAIVCLRLRCQWYRFDDEK